MNRNNECVELQSRMIEHFSDTKKPLPDEVKKHLEVCSECRKEYEQMHKALTLLHESSGKLEQVPEHLFAEIEFRLDTVDQFKPSYVSSNKSRNLLILQYSYLATMAIIIWFSLLLTQPMFNNWLETLELIELLPVVQEYSLFILFFAVGGLFALISSPLIIKTKINKEAGPARGFLRRMFSSGLRIFAC
jgi:hypothetical protein